MATIGQALTAPEVGWRRFDNADSNITYDSSSEWSKYTNENGDYLNTATGSNSISSTITFNFVGTKLRLIGQAAYNRSTSTRLFIDGVLFKTFSTRSSELVRCSLDCEVTGLNYQEHYVTIINDAIPTGGWYWLDAVDIDDNGELKAYNPTPSGSDQAFLRVTMIDSSEREYELTTGEIDGFINWFNNHTSGDQVSYMLNKSTGLRTSKEYLAFDKIISFEVTEVK